MPDASRPQIVIIGAGPLGLVSALCLAEAGHAVAVYDAREADASQRDARVLALSHGSRQLLEQVDAWPAHQATAITTIHVSQRGALGRTEMNAAEYGLPALGYVVPAAAVSAALARQAQARGLAVHYGHRVARHTPSQKPTAITLQVTTEQGTQPLDTQLAVCCEGAVQATEKDDKGIQQRDYDQHALLLRATMLQPHGGRAWERFTPDGPIALLPLGQDYAVVWTVSGARLHALLQEDDASLCRLLQAAFGQRVRLASVGQRASYPLGLKYRNQPAQDRVVWLGNAAQTLHPVAGQGFNLALRDVWELADTLRDAPDPGSPSLLRAYASRRRVDRLGAIGFTDGLVRLFSSDNPLLTHLRGAGLLAMDVLPPLRHFVAKRMMFGARAWP